MIHQLLSDMQELEAALAAQQLASQQAASRMAVENQAVRAQLAALSKPQPPAAVAAAAAPAASQQQQHATAPVVAPMVAALPPAHSIALSAAAAASSAAKAAAAKAVPIAAPSAPPLPQQLLMPASPFALPAVVPPSAPPPAVAPFFRMPLPRLPGFASPVASLLPPAIAATPAVAAYGGAIHGASPLMQQHLAALAAMQAQVCIAWPMLSLSMIMSCICESILVGECQQFDNMLA